METLRIAVVSSPRCGNTWIRNVIAKALDLEQLAVHNYLDLPVPLPSRCCMQLHWYREPNFQKYLTSNCFRIVVLCRHPLDLLVSTLHFIRYEPMIAEWLKGNAEIPKDLPGKPPTSEAFLRYAMSWGAENLLSISYQWSHDPAVVALRYEDLVERPDETFVSLATGLKLPVHTFKAAAREVSLDTFQSLPNRHGWHGTPGLWSQLIPPFAARAIFRRHRHIFNYLGYSVPLRLLSRSIALRNWNNLQR